MGIINNLKKGINSIVKRKVNIKIDGEVIVVDGSYKHIVDDENGDYFIKQTSSATSLFVYSKLKYGQQVPMNDNVEFINGCRKFLNNNQGLVEVINTKTKSGKTCAYSIIKERLEPVGMMYILTLQIAYDCFVFNVHGEFREEGMTGVRDTLIYTLYQDYKEGKMVKGKKIKFKVDEKETEWARDPYDNNIKNGMLMNLSELPQFDKTFPNHPLSEARRLVKFFINNN